MFDPLTVKRLQLLEQDSRKQGKIAANPYPLVDGVEPDVLVLAEVINDCKIKLYGVMNLVQGATGTEFSSNADEVVL